MTGVPSFEDYLASLSPFAPEAAGAEPEALALCKRATATVTTLKPMSRATLADAVASDPHIVPVLAAVAGFSQERFRTWIKARFKTAGWVTLGRQQSAALIDALDEEFRLVELLEAQSERAWTWADVLARVMAPRQRAGSSVQAGRALEDAVEERVKTLGTSYQPRGRFTGKGGQTAPA